MPPIDFEKVRADLEDKHSQSISDKDVVSYALYPKVLDDYFEFRKTYGPVDRLDTRVFLQGPELGEELHVSLKGFFIYLECLFSFNRYCYCI